MLNLYLDTADRQASEGLMRTGLFRGFTTNPTLLRRAPSASSNLPEQYAWARELGADQVFFQTWGDTTAAMVDQGQALRSIGEQVVVKVVATRACLAAAALLARDDIPVLVTAVYNAGQALLAAAANAQYVAPYVGKMTDANRDGVAEAITMATALAAVGGETRVLAASLRSGVDVVRLAVAGIRDFAVSIAVAEMLLGDQLTDSAAAGFEDDIANLQVLDGRIKA